MTFNFAAAVAKSREEYPEETKNITFVNGTDPEAKAQVRAFFAQVSPRMLNLEETTATPDEAHAAITEDVLKGKAVSFRDYYTGKGILYLHEDLEDFGVTSSLSAKLTYAFRHELGHLLIEGGLPSDFMPEIENEPIDKAAKILAGKVNRCENMADAFASISVLASGDIAPDEIREVSFLRSQRALTLCDMDHVTSMLLDTIALDANSSNFVSLTPQERKAVAQAYADRLSPSQDDLAIISDMHALGRPCGMFGPTMQALGAATVILSLPKEQLDLLTPYSRYTAARVYSKIIQTGNPDIRRAVRMMHGSDNELENIEEATRRIVTEFGPLGKIMREFSENKADIKQTTPQAQPILLLTAPVRKP